MTYFKTFYSFGNFIFVEIKLSDILIYSFKQISIDKTVLKISISIKLLKIPASLRCFSEYTIRNQFKF
ncbi:hypothetical protein SDC9_57466 [bioreactor metagenome]|uniref:Uncharacterized protein n=1 Tax=bioreactor metagenome TaxID=1076179 RepID=A0A644X5A3_9ZZZZ